ncbi:MAG: Rieske 2Fe-2S domain-containing protein [Bacteroidia bacterium]|nr:Rieske 2Fe-2S domain-containing protein [Bacteroidia bacterium]
MTSRRDFLKQSCTACAMVAGFGFLLSQESCSTPSTAMKVAATNGQLTLPLSAFADQKTLVVREANMKNDILLVRKSAEEVQAFLMKCTHKGGSLRKSNDILICNLHGSNFNLEGNVIKEPAKNSLHQFPVRIDGQNLFVTINA